MGCLTTTEGTSAGPEIAPPGELLLHSLGFGLDMGENCAYAYHGHVEVV